MTTQLLELNDAQKTIYTRSNIGRAFPEFDDTEVTGIYLLDDLCNIVYRDGSNVNYPVQPIKDAFQSYTNRLKDFFSYLGPNYRGPSIWHDNTYIMFKGWSYVHALGSSTANAKLQAQWADKFIRLTDQERLKAILQSDQTDLGYLVAPDGIRIPEQLADEDSAIEEEGVETAPINTEPYCSCGSFQRQVLNRAALLHEIPGYKPQCIHLTWFKKYRELLCKRTAIRNTSASYAPDKCVAWWYAPPTDGISNGKFVLLYTTHGAQAPLKQWRTYKPKETFTQHDAWSLFDSMMEAGYLPFPGVALPQLQTQGKTL